jgi:hypothetical protein
MYGSERQNILSRIVPGRQTLEQEEEGIEEMKKAYMKIRKRAEAREKRRKRGNAKWEPELNEKVLVKTQPMSDAIRGISAKFMYLFEGPFRVNKILDHSVYELRDECGRIRGEFNKKQIKPYKEREGSSEVIIGDANAGKEEDV